MTQVGESIAVTTIADGEDGHWAQVEYRYSDGTPVQGAFIVKASDGLVWVGLLNDEGQACMTGLPPGTVEFTLVPFENFEDELAELRAQLKSSLDGILEEQRAEAAEYERQLASGETGYWSSFGQGLWNGAVGLVTFAGDVLQTAEEIRQYLSPVERLNNVLHAAYTSYRNGELTSEQWRRSVFNNYKDEELKDLSRLLGFDVSQLDAAKLQELKALIVEAYEIVAFIADDPESLQMLLDFGKAYAGAQSGVEWAEFAGGGVFEIVLAVLLTVFTGGVGTAAQVGSKVRHANRLRPMASMFRRLTKLLKRKKLSKTVKVNTDTKKTTKTERPKDRELSSNKKLRMKEHKPKCFEPGPGLKKTFKDDPKGMEKEFYKQLKAQEAGINKMTVGEYTANRAALQDLTAQHGHKKAREILTTGGKAQQAARDEFEAKMTRSVKESLRKRGIRGAEADKIAKEQTKKQMEQLAALHDPDLIAGGKDEITKLGDRSVNSSIGSQWAKDERVDSMDRAAQAAMAEHGPDAQMNITLERCK